MGPCTARVATRLDQVPPAPRTPSPAARALVFDRFGVWKAMGLAGALLLLIGVGITTVTAWNVPLDVAIALAPGSARGIVRSSVLNRNAEVLGRNPRLIGYEYEVGGARFTDGYSTIARVPEVGQPIALEVATFAPGWSRVARSTRNILGWGGLLPLLLAALGALLVTWAVRSRHRETRAFVHGRPVLARVVFRGEDTRAEYTDPEARGRPAWAITWEYRAPTGDVFRNTVASADPEDLAPYGDAKEIVVLLDPEDPGTSAVYFA